MTKKPKKASSASTPTNANLGFEDNLWTVADKLRVKFNALQGDKLAKLEDNGEDLADIIFWISQRFCVRFHLCANVEDDHGRD